MFPSSKLAYWLLGCVLVPALLALAGCTPSIGDKCVLSTDCSIRGDRLCDTSQPGGYCTIFNCGGNSCPDDGACILFHGSVQGCPYNDYAVSRTGRSFCMAWCSSNSDCRDGYECHDPKSAPWSAIDLDDDQSKSVCIPIPSPNPPVSESSVAPVCQATPDGGLPAPYNVDGGADAAAEAGAPDAGADADAGAKDAGDAGVEAGADASDAGAPDASDAALD